MEPPELGVLLIAVFRTSVHGSLRHIDHTSISYSCGGWTAIPVNQSVQTRPRCSRDVLTMFTKGLSYGTDRKGSRRGGPDRNHSFVREWPSNAAHANSSRRFRSRLDTSRCESCDRYDRQDPLQDVSSMHDSRSLFFHAGSLLVHEGLKHAPQKLHQSHLQPICCFARSKETQRMCLRSQSPAIETSIGKT
jgi:hypothetical protein